MRHALCLPPSGELADPRALADLAAAAETSGWDGVFVWDHVLRPQPEPQSIADPWIALAVMAVATERVRLGPMVTPITRRRPIKLARETITLDHLSRGRLTLGLGLGVDTSGELSKFGEVVDPQLRGARLDEGVDLLCALWSGEPVAHRGQHFVADDVTVRPRPVQRPRIPLWFAARGDARKPVRRAAKYDGLYPVDVDATQLAAMVDLVRVERGSLDGFDIVARPGDGLPYSTLADLGATWAITDLAPGVTADRVGRIAAAPPQAFFVQ